MRCLASLGGLPLGGGIWSYPVVFAPPPLDLLKAVRGDGKLAKVPFVMVTAQAQTENVLEAAKAGVSNYIVRPFPAD